MHVPVAGLGSERGRDYDEGRKYASGQDSATGYGSGYGGRLPMRMRVCACEFMLVMHC